MRYMLAVGPPISEITPVKPGVRSRICSISRRIEASERFWMMRPSCSVNEQKLQPPNQRRMMVTEKRIMSQAGIFARSEEHTSEIQSPLRISYAVLSLKKNIE